MLLYDVTPGSENQKPAPNRIQRHSHDHHAPRKSKTNVGSSLGLEVQYTLVIFIFLRFVPRSRDPFRDVIV